MEQNKFRNLYINSIVEQLADYVVVNINSKPVQEKIQLKILDPMIDYIGKRLYPYILMVSICFVLLTLLLIIMISQK